ncbi:MAG: glutamine amidotransferase [Ruminococcaceae bacterium]|nr:glutamine amidotransferase [Oscillospiraceae bacterium]
MKILHLFYDLLNLYGEYGNLCVLERGLKEKGIEVTVDKLSIGEEFDFSQYDLIYIGSGTERNQKVALQYLMPYKKALSKALDSGKTVLATGNSFEMFGKTITDCNKKEYEALGLFDFYTEESDQRTVTDAKSKCKFCEDTLIGFINKASEIKGIKNPFCEMLEGCGNTADDKNEGIQEGNFYGTHLIGPVLVRNPALLQHFVELLSEKQ